MTSAASIKWVAFDAVGTLLQPHPSVHVVYHRIGRRHGSGHSAHQVRVRFRRAYASALAASTDLVTSDQCERDFWRRVVGEVLDDVVDAQACFEELHAWYARPEAWRLHTDVTQTLSALHDRGQRLAIASNFDTRLVQVCAGFSELSVIEHSVISSQVGCHKPGAAFFDALVLSCGCAPEQILMVGDDLTNDVRGAGRRDCRQCISIARGSGAVRPSPD